MENVINYNKIHQTHTTTYSIFHLKSVIKDLIINIFEKMFNKKRLKFQKITSSFKNKKTRNSS